MTADIAALEEEVAELRATVARLASRLDTGAPVPAELAPHSRRDLLKLAGGVAAGAAGGLLLSAGPAAAVSADSLTVGAQHAPDPGTSPTSGIDYSGASNYFGVGTAHAVFSVTDDARANGIAAAIIGAGAGVHAHIGVAGAGSLYDFWAVPGRVPPRHAER